jgi:hypothetical protein
MKISIILLFTCNFVCLNYCLINYNLNNLLKQFACLGHECGMGLETHVHCLNWVICQTRVVIIIIVTFGVLMYLIGLNWMFVVAPAYYAHLDLCPYFYCLCFIIVIMRGNASKLVVVVWGCYCFSAEHCSFFGMPSTELLRTHEEKMPKRNTTRYHCFSVAMGHRK